MPRSGRHRQKCCVKGCSKIRTDSAFRFPMNELRSQLWLERCRDESLYKYSTVKLHANKRVCEKHFAPHAFTNVNRHRLNYDAVPSIFPYNCSSVFAKSKNYVQVTKRNDEIRHEDCSSKVPLPDNTEDMQQEYYVIVASPESTEGTIQEECYVIVPSPEDTEDILEIEHHLPVPLPENTEDITEKEYHLPVSSQENNKNMTKKECHLPVLPSPENTEDISDKERQLPVLSPELPLPENKDKEKYDSSVPLAPGNEITIQEKSYLIVQSPEDADYILQETCHSKDRSCSDSVPIPVKSSNCSKEILRLCKSLPIVKNLKETINKNCQKLNIPQPKNIDGNNISPSEAANPCSMKSVNFLESCGLTGCTDDLYSDAKNVKQLVKCSFKCGRYFHLTCTGLTKVQYHVMCTSDALRWFCEECRTGIY